MENPQKRRENGKTPTKLTNFYKNGRFFSPHQILGQGTFPHHQMVILGLGVLNVVLLIVAIAIGINCAKARQNSLDARFSSAFPLFTELNYLRSNHSDVIQAEEAAQKALQSEIDSHAKIKEQIQQQRSFNDKFHTQIETLQEEKEQLQTNKSALGLSCGKCLPGWILYSSSCYLFSRLQFDIKKNWQDSRADCISHGADLVVIEDLEEQMFVMDGIQGARNSNSRSEREVWIGLTDTVEEGKWVWVNNVTAVDTMYWMDGEPNNIGPWGENCVAAAYTSSNPSRPKSWNDAQCDQLQRYWICETKST